MTLARSKPRFGDTVCKPERAAYDRDFYTWTLEQAALIREGRFAEWERGFRAARAEGDIEPV